MKGGYVFGNGLTGIYHVELALNPDKGTGGSAPGYSPQDNTIDRRFAFAGVKGGFGTAVFGTASSPYKMAGLKLDPFYDTSAGTGFAGANYGLSGFTNGFFDNVIAYFTPNWGGFSGNAVVVLDEASNDQHHHYDLGFAFEHKGFGVGLQWLDVNASTPANEVDASIAPGSSTGTRPSAWACPTKRWTRPPRTRSTSISPVRTMRPTS